MRKLLNKIFDFLSSIMLTIFVLSAVTGFIVLQICGQKIQSLFKDLEWLKAVAAIDFFHSTAFVLLLMVFCVNLLACCVQHLRRTIELFNGAKDQPEDTLFDKLPVVQTVTAADFESASEKVSGAFAAFFKKTAPVKDSPGQRWFYAERGRYTTLGFYLAHLSILTLVIGVIISLRGYHYTFDIAKGAKMDPLAIEDSKKNRIELDFGLQCDDAKVIFRTGTNKIDHHESTLSILKNGTPVKTQLVDFGHPLHYEGVDIYQNLFNKSVRYARIKVTAKNGSVNVFEIKKGGSFTLSDSGITIQGPTFQNDSIELKSFAPGASLWITRNPARFSSPPLNDYEFVFQEFFFKDLISLKAIRDPGQTVVWYSFLSMMAGFSVMFFFSYTRIWARVEKKGDECVITLGGTATKNLDSLKKAINALHTVLKERVQ